MTKITPPRKKELYKMYCKYSIKRISSHLGVGSSTVGRWLSTYGIARNIDRRQKIPSDLKFLYIDLNWSARKIGKKYNKSSGCVRRWLTRLGIKIRDRRYNLPIPDGLKELYLEKKMSQKKIGRVFGVSQKQISNWMRKLQIQPRFGDRKSYIGPNHPRWKGGEKLTSKGRIKVWKPDHPRADSNGYVYRQILVWEKHRGPIPPNHVVHHLNGVKTDDRISNFQLMKKSDHSPWLVLHAVQKRVRELERKVVKLGGKI